MIHRQREQAEDQELVGSSCEKMKDGKMMCARARAEETARVLSQATTGLQPFTEKIKTLQGGVQIQRFHNIADKAQHLQSSPSSAMLGMWLASGWLSESEQDDVATIYVWERPHKDSLLLL